MSSGNTELGQTNGNRWKIAVLSGGDSDERSISLKSGQAVVAALSQRGHFVLPVDPAVVPLKGMDWNGFDVVFIALHGRFGEDGEVQSLLEESGIPYTGSNAEASRIAFDKRLAKAAFEKEGVPTPRWRELSGNETAEALTTHAGQIGWPLVIKPASQGSSLGVTIVQDRDQLYPAYCRARHYDSSILMEAAIIGSEWTVGLLDDEILPPICVQTDREFFDWTAKYEDDATRYLLDEPLSVSSRGKLEAACRQARRALGVSGLSRVDLMLDQQGDPHVLEINTVPGLTDHSLVPKAAGRLGMTLGELCEETIRRTLACRPRRPHLLRRTAFSVRPGV
jgi:D-alanine-D-alanine ligase